MKVFKYVFRAIVLILVVVSCKNEKKSEKSLPLNSHGFIEISTDNPAYFQFSDGTPYIPVGINMINPSGRYRNDPDSSLLEIEQWMKNLSENGGNYIRIWLSQSFWDVEDKKAGEYSEEKARRIDRFIELARKYNLRIKMTLEHFRSLTMEENPQSWALKSVYHKSNGGPLDSIRQYLTSEDGHNLFLKKIDYYRERYGSDTLFFGWELWNEMNAMEGPTDDVFFTWNEKMLSEVKKLFPENLCMQSLGSFDSESVRPAYKKLMLLPGNEVAQVHRYLDLGARMDVCHMPMDIICSSAIDELISYNTGKPVILAETGAVEPSHSGPSKFYPADTAGILLHDILFAPFFSGSAAAGMSWHWESYVDKNNLWYHYERFSAAVKDINPISEEFVPGKTQTDILKIYMLNGKSTILLWLRDKENTWQNELAGSKGPETISGAMLDLNIGLEKYEGNISVYDPWRDKWSEATVKNMKALLPDFKRSIVVRINK